MGFFETVDAIIRALRDLATSATRRILRTYIAFVRWLRQTKKWIADQLESDGLLKDLYCAVCETFDMCPEGDC